MQRLSGLTPTLRAIAAAWAVIVLGAGPAAAQTGAPEQLEPFCRAIVAAVKSGEQAPWKELVHPDALALFFAPFEPPESGSWFEQMRGISIPNGQPECMAQSVAHDPHYSDGGRVFRARGREFIYPVPVTHDVVLTIVTDDSRHPVRKISVHFDGARYQVIVPVRAQAPLKYRAAESKT